jgi:hypothetical protein
MPVRQAEDNETINGETGKKRSVSLMMRNMPTTLDSLCASAADITDQTLYWKLADFMK